MHTSIKQWYELCSIKAGLGKLKLYEIESLQQLQEISFADNKQPLIIGNCTNLIGSDNDFIKPVIKLAKQGEFSAIKQVSEDSFLIGCACNLTTTLQYLAECGFGGLSKLSGIPANLGGALAMNCGALGQEISASVQTIEGWNFIKGEPWTWQKDAGGWAYRTSVIPENTIALQVLLKMQKVNPHGELQKIKEELHRRNKTAPKGASAGSVFKNPENSNKSAGQLLDEAGCKGWNEGEFSVSQEHANWIVNLNRKAGKAEDCKKLIDRMRENVLEKSAIKLDCELRVVRQVMHQ